MMCLHPTIAGLCAGALIAVMVSSEAAAQTAAQVTPALVDRDLTVGAGATLAVAAGDLVARLESAVVPDRIVDEHGVVRRTADVAYRSAKLLFFDKPQEDWLMVANHEVFGHGGRVRELFDGYLQFHIDAPKPYGDGGGVTTYAPERDPTVHELQAVSVAGMEVNSVGAAILSRRAFRERMLTPRAALRYLLFELDGFDYIQHTSDEPQRPGHDVSDFVVLYNLSAGAAGADEISPEKLRHESWISLANPMIASAVISIGGYLATGRTETHVLALPVAGWDVMPAMRYRLAPFGTEWAIVTDVAKGRRSGQLNVRSGRAPLTHPWGISAILDGFQWSGWTFEIGGDVWRQPPLALGAVPDFGIDVVGKELEWGGAARVRFESPGVRLWKSAPAVSLVIDGGGKSQGFIAGEPLDGGLVLRAGLGLPLGRR
jgi:hypothetical protein